MGNHQKLTGRTDSMALGLAIGTAVSAVITLLMTAALAKMIDTGSMEWGKIGYGIMAITVVSPFVGAKVAYGRVRRRKILVCGLSGVIYFFLLLTAAVLLFGGQFEAVGVTVLLVLAGSGMSVLVGTGEGRRSRGRNVKLRYR